jgi:hypothetical protein
MGQAYRNDEKIQFVMPTPKDRENKLVCRVGYQAMHCLFVDDIVELYFITPSLADDLESDKFSRALVSSKIDM